MFFPKASISKITITINKSNHKFQSPKKPPIINPNPIAFLSGFASSASISSFCGWSWLGGSQSGCYHGHARTTKDISHLFRIGFGFPDLQKQDPVVFETPQILKGHNPNLYKSSDEGMIFSNLSLNNCFKISKIKLNHLNPLHNPLNSTNCGLTDFPYHMKTHLHVLFKTWYCSSSMNIYSSQNWISDNFNKRNPLIISIITNDNSLDVNFSFNRKIKHVMNWLVHKFMPNYRFRSCSVNTNSYHNSKMYINIDNLSYKDNSHKNNDTPFDFLSAKLKVKICNFNEQRRYYNFLNLGWCCVSVDLTRPLICKVNILKSNGVMLTLKVWYEDFSEGCGCCGGGDHAYEDCPINKPQPRRFQVILEDNPNQESTHNHQKTTVITSASQPPISVSPDPKLWQGPFHYSAAELGSSSNPIFTSSITTHLPLNCFPQMINPELFRQFVALHNSNPSLPHPNENLALPANNPIPPNVLNCNLVPSETPTETLHAVVSQQLSQVATVDINRTSSQETSKSDATIVKKMEKVAIKQSDQSSTDSDPGKRKEEQDSKEISSPTTKRARKKKY